MCRGCARETVLSPSLELDVAEPNRSRLDVESLILEVEIATDA